MQDRGGKTISNPFPVTSGVRQILSSVLFNLYMDGLSRELDEWKTGCMVGNQPTNHLMYADDLIIMSPYSACLQQLFVRSMV